MSMKFYRNIRTGETGYIDVKDSSPSFDANKIYGYGYAADYHFGNFILHVAIASVTGFIAASIIGSTVLGIIIGIISFVISTIVHLAKEGDLFDTSARKDTVIKQIRNYLITIGIAAGISALCFSLFGAGIGTIISLVAVIVAVIIIRKTDKNRATL